MIKPKSKKVLFVFQDHWKDVIHYVERWLTVSTEVRPEGIFFKANEDDAETVFEEMKTDSNLIEKLDLKPKFDDSLSVDASLISVLIASKDSVRPVELATS